MGKQRDPNVVRLNDWTIDGNWGGNGSGVKTVGFFLIVVGLLLAAGQLFGQAQIGASAFFLALGVVLLLVGIRDRSDLALYAGMFVTALALSDVLTGVGLIHGEGWGTLFLGLGVMLVALIRSKPGKRTSWTLGIGALLALWGGSQVLSSQFANFPADRLIGPLLIVLLGLYVLTRSRRRDA
jgi:hypothetical protein